MLLSMLYGLRCVRKFMAGVFRSARHAEANDRYLRIPLKKSNPRPRSEFSRPWTGFGEIHSGGYTTLTDRTQRLASSAREAIQHPRPHVRDKFENFGPDRFPTFSTISAQRGRLYPSGVDVEQKLPARAVDVAVGRIAVIAGRTANGAVALVSALRRRTLAMAVH